MEKLKEAQLFRSELIPVRGKLVERYNRCLANLGIAPTQLSVFTIDGIGWSPEIAEEKQETHYLNHGDANSQGIIITPLQKGKPVFAPFHSFDREMMQLIFQTHGAIIDDVTRDSAICIDFDQHIDVFYEPLDLLKYQDITITFRIANGMDMAQKAQLQLVETFRQGNNFIDEELHKKLLASAKTYGDLRHRDFNLYELNFKSDSFYTKAFKGVFVLRDFITPIVIFEDWAMYQEAIKNTTYEVLIFHISQPELMEKLRGHLIVECDLETVVKTERYDRIKKFLFSQLLQDVRHPMKAILDDKILFRSYLNKLDIESRKRVMGVELYLEKLEVSNQYKIGDMVDLKLYESLHQPHSSLTAQHQDLIWKLLVNVAALDVLHLFWYDKETFYQMYLTWDDSLKDWAIAVIRSNI